MLDTYIEKRKNKIKYQDCISIIIITSYGNISEREPPISGVGVDNDIEIAEGAELTGVTEPGVVILTLTVTLRSRKS